MGTNTNTRIKVRDERTSECGRRRTKKMVVGQAQTDDGRVLYTAVLPPSLSLSVPRQTETKCKCKVKQKRGGRKLSTTAPSMAPIHNFFHIFIFSVTSKPTAIQFNTHKRANGRSNKQIKEKKRTVNATSGLASMVAIVFKIREKRERDHVGKE